MLSRLSLVVCPAGHLTQWGATGWQQGMRVSGCPTGEKEILPSPCQSHAFVSIILNPSMRRECVQPSSETTVVSYLHLTNSSLAKLLLSAPAIATRTAMPYSTALEPGMTGQVVSVPRHSCYSAVFRYHATSCSGLMEA